MNDVKTLSFDMYEKYFTVASYINSIRKNNETFKILEVGGRGEILPRFLPSDEIYILDQEQISDSTNFILGDATSMPFDDNAFDFVVSCDVLEHIDIADRESFILEHYRCSRHAAIIIAPFEGNDIEKLEDHINNNYKRLSGGQTYRWLDEHKVFGLPSEQHIETVLQKHHIDNVILPMGNSALWNFMLNLSHLVVFFNWQYPSVYEKFNEFNYFFNTHIAPFDRDKSNYECYRRVIIMRKGSFNDEMSKKFIGEVSTDWQFIDWKQASKYFWDIIIQLIIEKNNELEQVKSKLAEEKRSMNEIILLLTEMETNLKKTHIALEKEIENRKKIEEENEQLKKIIFDRNISNGC